MDRLPPAMVFESLSFLNASSLSSAMGVNKMLACLAFERCKTTPCMKSACVQSIAECDKLLASMQSPPTLCVVMCSSEREMINGPLRTWAAQRLPRACACIAYSVDVLQVASASQGKPFGFHRRPRRPAPEGGLHHVTLTLGAFPDAAVDAALVQDDSPQPGKDVVSTAGLRLDERYESFIVCSSNGRLLEIVSEELQARYREASIVGGITASSVAAWNPGGARPPAAAAAGGERNSPPPPFSTSGVVVMGIRGNAPMVTVVSRGVDACSPPLRVAGVAEPLSRVLSGRRQLLAISELAEEGGGASHPASDLVVRSVSSFPGQMMGIFVGTRTAQGEPYTLRMIEHRQLRPDALLLVLSEDEARPQGLRIFGLTPSACERDVAYTLETAKGVFAERGWSTMGALMFSCTGRGPSTRGASEAFDANTFLNTFPGVPLAGAYVNGEVGPCAKAGVDSTTVFRVGEASLQGMTAVFTIFAVPRPEPSRPLLRELTFGDVNVAFRGVLAGL